MTTTGKTFGVIFNCLGSRAAQRFEFVQNVVNYFWKKWTRDYFPSLLIQPKWHTAQHNLREGDVVLIQDTNQIRGQWKLGVVLKTFPGEDGRVRRVQVQYKNPKPGEVVNEYNRRGFVTVERAVNMTFYETYVTMPYVID